VSVPSSWCGFFSFFSYWFLVSFFDMDPLGTQAAGTLTKEMRTIATRTIATRTIAMPGLLQAPHQSLRQMIRIFTQQTSVHDSLQPEIHVLLDRISQQHMSACNVVIVY